MPQTQPAGIREYELIYVLRPTADNAEAQRVNGKVTEIIERFGGKLTKLDNWGRRRLAYPIQKNARGLFIYAKYMGVGDIVAEVERNLRITDSVLRQQTVLLRRDIDPASVEVDPEELNFAPVDEAEPEEEIGIEQRLGLVSAPKRSEGDRDRDRDRDGDKSEGSSSAKGEGAGEDAAKKDASAAPAEAKEGEAKADEAKADEAKAGEAKAGEAKADEAKAGEAETAKAETAETESKEGGAA